MTHAIDNSYTHRLTDGQKYGPGLSRAPRHAVARPRRLPGSPSLLPAPALYLALRGWLQLPGWLLPIHLPCVGRWELGPGCTWRQEGVVGPGPPGGPPPRQAGSAASLLLPVEPSGGLAGPSPGLDSETDFCDRTVARSCNPDGMAGQRRSAPRRPRPCPQTTYLDPFGARMQGVAPTASSTSHAAQAAAAVPTCQHEGAPSVGAGPAAAWEAPLPCSPGGPPTYLQKASSAPRSPRGAQRAPVSCLPGMGLVQYLPENLWTRNSLLESQTSRVRGPDMERGVSLACLALAVSKELREPQKTPSPPYTFESRRMGQEGPGQAVLPVALWSWVGRAEGVPPLCQGSRGGEEGPKSLDDTGQAGHAS